MLLEALKRATAEMKSLAEKHASLRDYGNDLVRKLAAIDKAREK